MIVDPYGQYCTEDLAEESAMMLIVVTVRSGSRIFKVGLLPNISAMMITASPESSFQNVLPLDRAKNWASEPR